MPEDLEFDLSGPIKLSDLVRFQYSHCYRRTWWLVAIMLLFSLAVVLVAVTVALLTSHWELVFGSGMPFVLLLLFWAFIVFCPYWGARRQLKSSVTLSEPATCKFTSHGIARTGPHFSSELSYGALWAVRETKTMFLLYLSSSAAFVLPKRFFHDASQQSAWRAFMEARIAPKRIAIASFLGRWL